MQMDQLRLAAYLTLLLSLSITVGADSLPQQSNIQQDSTPDAAPAFVEESARVIDTSATPPESLVDIKEPSLGKKILWYIPNRVMDFLDIFRIRIRLGPGLAANVRATDYAVFYAGKYDTIYVGVPGSRQDHLFRSPVGRESLNGLIIAGVDATDHTPHGPEYGASEFNIGAHFLIVGVEVGIDPLEIWDFLTGFLLLDPSRDDYPRQVANLPETTSGISIGEGEGVFRVEPKPEMFDSLPDRLNYLGNNVPRRISEPLRATDAYFALSPEDLIHPPQTQIRIKLFVELMQGRSFVLNVEPDAELDLAFPNIERRLRLFIETARADELPERRLTETEDRGVNVGLRKWFAGHYLSADAGVNARWTPDVFARLSWGRDFELDGWGLRPKQRLIVNIDDGFTSLSTLNISRWLGGMKDGIVVNSASVKWSQSDPDWHWSDNIAIARVNRLLDENRRGGNVVWEDAVHATSLFYQLLGDHHTIHVQRIGVAMRRPLYGQWVIGELRVGVERETIDKTDDSFFAHLGIDMLFWSTTK